MTKILLLLVIHLFILLNIPLKAQFKDWSNKFGIRGSLLLPENEFANFGFSGNDDLSFNWYSFSYTGEAFFGFNVSRDIELQLNLGLGVYAGEAYFDDPEVSYGEYKSTIIPVNLRLRVSPWDNPEWNPYYYFGAGVMSFDLAEILSPEIGGENTNDAGWCGIFPLGVGAEFILSNQLLFDASFGFTFSTNSELDGYSNGDNVIGDYYLNLGFGLSFISESCKSDRDGDGLGRCDEEKSGTDPYNPDTDTDGLTDGDELLIYKTDALKSDTDGDLLSDFDELITYKTDALKSDTDIDGLSDGEEVIDYTTDPLKVDSDSDDLTDGDEVLKYKTLPLRSDSDSDGLADGGELLTHKTDPLNLDTDMDGLSDGDEVINYGTNPLNTDTDGGTVTDFHEIRRDTDPFNANDDIIKVDVPIVLEGIMFEKDKSNITPESEIILQGALETLKTYSDIIVEISGHTDNIGGAEHNMALSQRRADSVRFWLIERGIEPDRIIAKGYGMDSPRVPNDTRENRTLNRRIEFKRIK